MDSSTQDVDGPKELFHQGVSGRLTRICGPATLLAKFSCPAVCEPFDMEKALGLSVCWGFVAEDRPLLGDLVGKAATPWAGRLVIGS